MHCLSDLWYCGGGYKLGCVWKLLEQYVHLTTHPEEAVLLFFEDMVPSSSSLPLFLSFRGWGWLQVIDIGSHYKITWFALLLTSAAGALFAFY